MSAKSKPKKWKTKTHKVPNVRAEDVVAIVCSDIHFSHRPPVARSTEPDWYAAMARPINEMAWLCEEYECPLLIAGDIFDKPSQPPELVNWAIKMFKQFDEVIAIPGQHDLPNHSYGEIKKSAFWTLVAANCITSIIPHETIQSKLRSKLLITGFPWETEVGPPQLETEDGRAIQVALIHAYIWSNEENKYPGAPKTVSWDKWTKKLKEYDACFFGDNHRWFIIPGNRIFNCGTLMRRKVDEIPYEPAVFILTIDGCVHVHKLDCSQDKFIDFDPVLRDLEDIDPKELLNELSDLVDQGLDFVEIVKRACRNEKMNRKLRHMILQSLEKKE